MTKPRPESFKIHAHPVPSWAACTGATGAVLPATGLVVSPGAGLGTGSGTGGALLELGGGTAAGALLGEG